MDILMDIGRGLIGIVGLIGILYLCSTNKKAIDWTLVVKGIAFQIVVALLMLKVPPVRYFFSYVVDFFVLMINATGEASKFLFGALAEPGGEYGFAFFVLPTIIFFSATSSLLYYLGILQKIVYGFAWVMQKTFGLSGAESLAAAANVFIGQTEAPVVVKPYLEKMTRSEVLCLMTGGMATIAGGVFGAYIAMLGGENPERMATFGMHLLTASIISAPAAIVAAKILFPETEPEKVNQNINIPPKEVGDNFLDALSRGTTDGLKLAVNVGAMLLAFIALIFFANTILLEIGKIVGLNEMIAAGGKYEGLTMQYIMGFVFWPVAWLIGIESADCLIVGQLLAEKTILNEFFAYDSLSKITQSVTPVLSERSMLISTYALCGFANFSSIGIQIGGIGAIAPGQRKTLSEFGIQALIGGAIACFLTACVAAMIV